MVSTSHELSQQIFAGWLSDHRLTLFTDLEPFLVRKGYRRLTPQRTEQMYSRAMGESLIHAERGTEPPERFEARSGRLSPWVRV